MSTLQFVHNFHYHGNTTCSWQRCCHLLRIVLIVCVCCCSFTTAIDDHQDSSGVSNNDHSPTTNDVHDNGVLPPTTFFDENSPLGPNILPPTATHPQATSKWKTLPNRKWSRNMPTTFSFEKDKEQSTTKFEVPSQIFTLASTKQPICRRVLDSVTPKTENYLSVIRQSIQNMVHVEDITLLSFLGWMSVPIGQWIYEWLPSIIPQYNNNIEFQNTLYYEIVDHGQQLARIALAVYCFDIVKLTLIGLGYKIPGMLPITSMDKVVDGSIATPHAFSHILYTIWIANRVGYIKRKILRRYVNDHPESYGRITLIEKWIDFIIYAATVVMVLHILKVESGVAINRSFLAVGSVGTLAFGLASQGIATQVINGLLLASSDRIYEGDDVMLGSNGFAGNIVKLGWLETVIRGSDEILISIPNADLLKERVSNLSRVRHSQVKQIIRLRYDDVDKIPTLIKDMKHEIKKTCPSVIVDGSRPFRVHWTAINDDHCEITIDTRHHIKPVGDAYLDNKQNVLTAIYSSLKRHNCKLVEAPIISKMR